MTALTITQTCLLPDGQVERESVVLPMPSGDAGLAVLQTLCGLIEQSHIGGDYDYRYNEETCQARITLASGDRIELRVGES